ncbi:MAG: MFS transporter [Clostridia bacterium]|nr:MFS transporter [Clostridia bacterium]
MSANKKRLIYLIVYLAYTSIYISRVNLSVAEPSLEAMSLFDAAGYGVIGGLFSTVYSIGRLVNGTIGDKAPPWLMLSIGLGVAGAANIAIGFLPPYIGILLLWSINAYAQSMLWSSVLCVVSSIYKGPYLKRMTSLMVTAVASGNIIAILLGGWLILAFGVEFAFIIPGALNILLGGGVFLATRKISPADEVEDKRSHSSIFGLLKNRDILLMCIPSVFHGVMKENVTVWMVAYTAFAFGVDLGESAYYVLLIPVIGLIGRLIYPFFLKLFRERENSVALFGFAVCLAASVVLLFSGLGLAVAVVALGVVYASTSMINTSITSIYPMSYLESGNVSSVSGLLDFASYLGAGVSSAIYGIVIKSFGYVPMFISWILISVISVGVIILINKLRSGSVKPSKAKTEPNNT